MAIVGSALAIGSVHTATLCAVTVCLVVAVFLEWWTAEPIKVRAPATLILFTGIGLTAYTALQCVPLPLGFLRTIAPYNANIWARALAPLHESPPSWAPLSLDPPATRVQVLRGVAYVLTFLGALLVARRRNGTAVLSGTLVVTALTLAIAAIVHPALGLPRLFGFYEPASTIATRHIAPLLNPNNLASYLNVGICLSLANLLTPEPRVSRLTSGAAVLFLSGAQAWVASRGGVITMVIGIVVVAVVARAARARDFRAVRSTAIVMGVAVVAGSSLLVLSGADEAAVELLDRDTSKLSMFVEVSRAIPAMPFFGAGRGAFESVFPAFKTAPGFVTYTHPENVLAQWAIEWGLPVAILGIAFLAACLRPNVVLVRSMTAAGAWGAIVAIGVQNLADLGTEIPGLMIAAVVCAAIVVAGTPGKQPRWRAERWSRRPRVVAILALGLTIVALVDVLPVIGRELHDDQLAMQDALAGGRLSAQGMRMLAKNAMLRHPAEPYLPFVPAMRAAAEHDDDPIPWIGATLERAPVYAPAHLLLARMLSVRSPAQARMEYRVAMAQAREMIGPVMVEAPRLVASYDDAIELIPKTPDGILVTDVLSRGVHDRLPASASRLDAGLVATAPMFYDPAERRLSDVVEDLEAGEAAPWCTADMRQVCLKDALDQAVRLQQARPDSCQARALEARALAATGDVTKGMAKLAAATSEVSDHIECLKALAALARRSHLDGAADDALDKIAAASCEDEPECAQRLTWVGREFEAAGRPLRAISLYKKALELEPDERLLEHVATLAAAHGLHGEAAADFERLGVAHPEQEEWRVRAAEERAAAMREAATL